MTATPRLLAYCASPNRYFDERAEEVARLYDGFFFVVGDWEQGVATHLGVGSRAASTDWRTRAGSNLAHLRQAGATESLLGVHFSQDGAWPSPQTLLSPAYTRRLAAHFAALGRAARELGFAGVSIDVEYPYRRYSLQHEIYRYRGYTAEDLLAAAAQQGRAVMAALLDEFPQAVVFVLPGDLWGRPLGRTFTLALLEEMAARAAPGGFHLGYERAYGLLDPATQVAIPRVGDCAAAVLASPAAQAYWRRCCSVAPGVWPLHMVETGGEGYPVRPWDEELAELQQQLAILLTVTRRYLWSYSGHPLWYLPSARWRRRYALAPQAFPGAAEAIAGWHAILAGRQPSTDPRIQALAAVVSCFDRAEIGPAELCAHFGTPGAWLVLGPLGNPFTAPAYSAPGALLRPPCRQEVHHGRDGVVRWFTFHNCEPTGHVRLEAAFDWHSTDQAAAHLVATVTAPRRTSGFLWLGWDDGLAVWLNGRLLLDRRSYPPQGHGLLFRDRYLFEERVPVTLPRGSSRLALTSVNATGVWACSLRFGDGEAYPLPGLRFSLPRAPR